MSYYVRRVKESTPGGYAYVGPIRSERQANREAAAWNSCNQAYDAVVLESTPAVRADVRNWQKNVHALRFGTFPGWPPANTWADRVRFTR